MKKLIILTLFALSTASADDIVQAKVYGPRSNVTIPNCKGSLFAKLKSCEKYTCYQEIMMGLKFENIVHGASADKKFCVFSTPNQNIQLTETEKLRLAKSFEQMDQAILEGGSIGLGSSTNKYKFKDFSCEVQVRDEYDTTGLKIADGSCTDITVLNDKTYCSPKFNPKTKYSEYTLTKGNSPKCKDIDFNVMRDLYKTGRMKIVQPVMSR